jgi:hypothetical protein
VAIRLLPAVATLLSVVVVVVVANHLPPAAAVASLLSASLTFAPQTHSCPWHHHQCHPVVVALFVLLAPLRLWCAAQAVCLPP